MTGPVRKRYRVYADGIYVRIAITAAGRRKSPSVFRWSIFAFGGVGEDGSGMPDMRRRTIEIIQELLVGGDATLGGLAGRFGVSERTVRSDISTINGLLDSAGIPLLDYGHGGQIVVPKDFSRIVVGLPTQAKGAYRLSRDERRHLVGALLVDGTGYVTISDIADRLSTSRTTIVSDLDAIRDSLRGNCLTLTSRPGKGLVVEGEEAERRSYLLLALSSITKIPDRLRILGWEPQAGDDAVIIRKVLNEQGHAHGVRLSDDSFSRIVDYLCIAVRRLRVGRWLEDDGTEPAGAGIRSAFCTDVLRLVAQYCFVDVNRAERNYLEGVLSSVSLQVKEEFKLSDVRMQVFCRKLIARISEAIDIDLNGDYVLFEYLSNHLATMFALDPPQFSITEEVRQVIAGHADIMDVVRRNRDALEDFGGRAVSETELGYICVHLCAALERRKSREWSLRVIVACNSGVGTSQLLAENLRGRFDFKIVRVIPSHEASLLCSNDADLVISTVSLEDCPIRHVVISAYPSESEYARVRRHVDEMRTASVRAARPLSEKSGAQGLVDIVSSAVRDVAPDVSRILVPRLASAIRSYFGETGQLEQRIIQPFLHQLLPPSHIQLDVRCTDWRDAIAASAAPLVEMGCIEPRYVDAMVCNIEENGPYVLLSQNFAMPHAASDEGALKVSMNLVRLSRPVIFGDSELDPVDLVCCLSAVDNKSHLRAFFNLVNLLRMPLFKEGLRRAQTPQEASQAIWDFEHRLDA